MALFRSLTHKVGGFVDRQPMAVQVLVYGPLILAVFVFFIALSLTLGIFVEGSVLVVLVLSWPFRTEYERNKSMLPELMKDLLFPLFPLFMITSWVNTFLPIIVGVVAFFVPLLRTPEFYTVLLLVFLTGILGFLIQAELDD